MQRTGNSSRRSRVDDEATRLGLTTTNTYRLDEVVGPDSTAIDVVGKPYDLQEITTAITAALRTPKRLTGSRRDDASLHDTPIAHAIV
jgi:DNA-binding response OmpR family regulator